MSRNKLHTVYKNSEGKRLVGVSSVKGQLGWNTRGLMYWVKKCSLQGLDFEEVSRLGAGVGTLTHNFIKDYFLKSESCMIVEFTKVEIDKASNSYLSFLEWVQDKDILPYIVELGLVSEKYQFEIGRAHV